jgi:flagellin-like hook-associated protein FlgL
MPTINDWQTGIKTLSAATNAVNEGIEILGLTQGYLSEMERPALAVVISQSEEELTAAKLAAQPALNQLLSIRGELAEKLTELSFAISQLGPVGEALQEATPEIETPVDSEPNPGEESEGT